MGRREGAADSGGEKPVGSSCDTQISSCDTQISSCDTQMSSCDTQISSCDTQIVYITQ